MSSQNTLGKRIIKEELCTEISEILKVLIGNKQHLLQLIEKRLALSIPKSYSYRKIVERIVSANREKEFCELFQLKDFVEMLAAYRNWTILEFFSNDELRLVGQKLCETKYDPSNRNSLIDSISRNTTEDQLIDAFTRISLEKEEKNIVQQQKRWIVGPLGLLKSSTSRKWYSAIELIDVLETYLNDPPQFAGFLARLKAEPEFDWKINVDDPLYKSKCIQLILVFFNDDSIIEILNQLVDNALLVIDFVKKTDGLIVSPYGIFEEGYFGYENLVNLLLNTFANELNYLDSELRSEGLTRGSIELRIREICLKKTPEEIIKTFFGLGPNLIKLAKEIGLVSLREIRKKEDLLQVILLKLGFTCPPTLEGIGTYLNNLRGYRRQLDSGIEEDRRRGLWNRVYSDSERILRDLILFFFSCVWDSKLKEYYKDDVKARKMKEMIKEEFGLTKPIDILTFGDLCELLSHINKEIQSNETLKKTVKSIFGRPYIIPQKDFKKLSYVRSARTPLTGIHPTKKRAADPIKTISKLIEISEEWSAVRRLGRVFPYLIRIKEERTNEFGISHSLAIDEEGNQWTLKKSRMWIRPEYAYYMLTDTDHLAIEPIMVEKFW
jgi:hypothetical protein